MNTRPISTITDDVLVNWIAQQWKSCTKEYKKCADDAQKINLLKSLAKILRQYINAVKTKRSGMHDQFKGSAHSMTQWLQKELFKCSWSESTDIILKSIQYARKHTGNLHVEGRALARTISVGERKRLARLTAKATQRYNDSLERVSIEDAESDDDYRNIGVLTDSAEMD